ncbi:MAG: MBL fold metallo-hydrolase [Chloroflexota bacterium]|nr:MBL fold metallo-hydrolase [Chloroflexota bacterium]
MVVQQLSEDLYCFEDTCRVYVIRSGSEAVLVDFGSGDVLEHLDGIGVERVTDVLMTHHHRDQGQGLARAVAAGARIWVPHMEQDLFHSVDEHWQAREIMNNYNMRQDRFSLLESVPVAGTLRDYGRYRFGNHEFVVLPTTGHTAGSITLLAEMDGRSVAFTGDLIAAPGKVWSLAATQWTYNKAEGVAATIASLLDLKERAPDLLLPSHGEAMEEPEEAIDLLVPRLWRLLRARDENPRLFDLHEQPYEPLTPHLLFNRTSTANSYVLLSESGKALFIDYGYDFLTGFTAGADRASRRPWLYTIPRLKEQYGVEEVEVVIPTHFHDDHVAGFNLLREVEGTKVWAPENMDDILQRPTDYDLPCLWYDPIPVDRVLPLEQPIRWEEYELTLYAQSGHTRYAVAIAFEVDGKQVLAIGDQYEREDHWNYVYQNRFVIGDYQRSAALYRKLKPEILLVGHGAPLEVTPELLDKLTAEGELLDALHHALLPLERVDFGAEGVGAWIRPYQSEVRSGETVEFEVEVRNPFPQLEEAIVHLVVPQGWEVNKEKVSFPVAAHGMATALFRVRPPANLDKRRARIAANLTVGGRQFGQQAEALVTARGAGSGERKDEG